MGSVVLNGATSGATTITPTDGVTATLSLPSTTGTLLTSSGAISNLSGGSNGTIPYQSASGTTQMLAVGTSGQVLQTNGAGAPSWVTPSSGAMTLISTQTASNSVITFTGLTGYNDYLLVFKNLQCSSQLYLQVSTNSGSSYLSSGYAYTVNCIAGQGNTISTFYNYMYTSGGNFYIGGMYNNVSTGGFGCSGTANITGLLSNFCSITGQSIAYYNSSVQELDNFSGSQTTSQTINALKISSGGGNIVSGTASLYGISS